jgi:arsenate reductase
MSHHSNRLNTLNVLFLCTGNSARSLIAEAVLNAKGAGTHQAFSAGSRPTGTPNPVAMSTLARAGYETADLRSKSWDEFSTAGAASPDVVITLCDSAAADQCPVWIGSPKTFHWGLPDPAAVDEPAERRRAFEWTLAEIERRIDEFLRAGRDDG